MAWPVLLLARELDLGGSERQMTEIAKTLDRSRFIPHVGCFRPQGIRNAELAARGVPIVHFPVDSFASFGAICQAWRLADYIRQQGIRLVHTFDYPTTLFAVPVARLGTRAVVVSSQRSHRSLIPRKYLRWIRMTDRMSDAIVVNCEFVGRHLRKDEGVPSARIRLCYNGVDLDAFEPRESGARFAAAKSIHHRRGLRAAAGEGFRNLDRSLRPRQAAGMAAADRGEWFHAREPAFAGGRQRPG